MEAGDNAWYVVGCHSHLLWCLYLVWCWWRWYFNWLIVCTYPASIHLDLCSISSRPLESLEVGISRWGQRFSVPPAPPPRCHITLQKMHTYTHTHLCMHIVCVCYKAQCTLLYTHTQCSHIQYAGHKHRLRFVRDVSRTRRIVCSLQAYLQTYINTFSCAFSRCHSYLCPHTQTFSPSLRSVGNKVAGIPFGSQTPPSSVPPLFIYILCLQRYRSGPVRQRQIISWPQRTVVSFCGFKGERRDMSRLRKEGLSRSFRNSCSSGVLHGKTSSTWNRQTHRERCSHVLLCVSAHFSRQN